MQTTDGVPITQGLRVWTNNVRRAVVDLDYGTPWQENGEWWFYVHEERGDDGGVPYRGVLQSESRVATRHPFTREKA